MFNEYADYCSLSSCTTTSKTTTIISTSYTTGSIEDTPIITSTPSKTTTASVPMSYTTSFSTEDLCFPCESQNKTTEHCLHSPEYVLFFKECMEHLICPQENCNPALCDFVNDCETKANKCAVDKKIIISDTTPICAVFDGYIDYCKTNEGCTMTSSIVSTTTTPSSELSSTQSKGTTSINENELCFECKFLNETTEYCIYSDESSQSDYNKLL